jgi:hypothetical protein
MRRDEEMSDFGLKPFLNRLWKNGKGKTITGQTRSGEWFRGKITDVRAKFGTDLGVSVILEDGNTMSLSGIQIARGDRFMDVEGL